MNPTTTYRIKTTYEDLQNHYGNVSTAWEFEDQDNVNQVWTCSTDRPEALERLLDTDPTVVSYDVAA